MNFDQSGLPPIQLVQDAFTYSLNYVKSGYDEMFKDFERQITRAHQANLQMLDEAKRQSNMTDEEYKRERAEMEEMFKQQMQVGPKLVSNELNKKFARDHLVPARELFKNTEKATPEILAALLLVECVRSPKDYKEIEKSYGPVVGNLVAELIHIERYGAQREENLGKASPDIKRAYSVQIIVSMMSAAEQAGQLLKRGRKPTFPEGHVEELFDTIKLVWGTDKNLDDRMLLVFNKTVELLSAKVRLQKDQDGDIALVPVAPPKPPKPPTTPPNNGGKNLPVVRKPPGNGSIGGDVF